VILKLQLDAKINYVINQEMNAQYSKDVHLNFKDVMMDLVYQVYNNVQKFNVLLI